MKTNILSLIGNTPLVKLNNTAKEMKGEVFAKLEFYNPTLSTKDRIALKIIEDAESKGLLKEGSILVEATSGNTGVSIAMISGIKGYKCILCVKDSISKEKYNLLKTMGAELVLCPSNVMPDHPDSYYSKAKSIAENTPNAYYVNQNFNKLNMLAHYETTGKEIWEQTKGKITYLIAAGSTGGTISGTGKYLKEKNPDIKVIGVDTKESILKYYHENGEFDNEKIYKSGIEGVGKNIITGNFDFDIIDEFIYVDKEESAEYARKLVLEDGIWAGHSSGAALQGLFEIKDRLNKNDLVVVIFSDHGSRYLSKIFSNIDVN
ncbi:MAG TPA: cysteine synthase family protein [Bacteroidetes bacterium]|nr:cysteine synthase family protein [Bacteroidota bacterium]